MVTTNIKIILKRMSVPNSSPQGSRNPAEGRMVSELEEKEDMKEMGLLNTTRPMHI